MLKDAKNKKSKDQKPPTPKSPGEKSKDQPHSHAGKLEIEHWEHDYNEGETKPQTALSEPARWEHKEDSSNNNSKEIKAKRRKVEAAWEHGFEEEKEG